MKNCGVRSVLYDVTDRVAEAHDYFDRVLEERIRRISEISEVPIEQFVKINPADFIEKSKYQTIRGFQYQNIKKFIVDKKTNDQTFLVSPLDAIEETAAQVSYKTGTEIRRKIRASKCEVVPCPTELAKDFFIRNHRQSVPPVRSTSVCFGLVHNDELVAVMLYDVTNGAVRGRKKDYELLRLSISKGTLIHGGASRLQQACEDTLRLMGITKIYSYSNATINSGAVYEKLGFDGSRVDGGQPFVILKNNKIVRLITLHPHSTDRELAERGWLITHLGGNRTWVKKLCAPAGQRKTDTQL